VLESRAMTRLSDEAMAAVKCALRDYCNELEESDLSNGSKGMYGDFAECFVRYLEGDFRPGSRLAPYGQRERKNVRSLR
jgi:hypothetical protein